MAFGDDAGGFGKADGGGAGNDDFGAGFKSGEDFDSRAVGSACLDGNFMIAVFVEPHKHECVALLLGNGGYGHRYYIAALAAQEVDIGNGTHGDCAVGTECEIDRNIAGS